ncbi:DUF6036 family nucleotidyltransferase [Verminephrobacter aporrectodeae]|uniref:DUF6036 family nucleotidyltransferase n=2 Tax=Verminephrobacter aporrectodeae TaxID=1110389 RepID=UPI00223806C4|nr:DUF6036 family nucleotidyltransferase [Verminephrobacter aporrectodeae]
MQKLLAPGAPDPAQKDGPAHAPRARQAPRSPGEPHGSRPEPASAREMEAALLSRCASVARQAPPIANDLREAHVFRLAAMLIQFQFPCESRRLASASAQYFTDHPDDGPMAPDALVRKGWVSNLPRLRSMLALELGSPARRGPRLLEQGVSEVARRYSTSAGIQAMPSNFLFHTQTALANGLRELFKQLAERLSLSRPMNVYLAGGMAVHLYTGSRVTTDVDAEFGSRVLIPGDLIVEVTLENGRPVPIYFDTNYNPTFALMHEDYLGDAIALDWGLEKIRLHVLSPVDLAVSKIVRFADNDKEDIAALVGLGLTTADAIEQRATSAIGGYVGGLAMLRLNLRDAVALARGMEGCKPPNGAKPRAP